MGGVVLKVIHGSLGHLVFKSPMRPIDCEMNLWSHLGDCTETVMISTSWQFLIRGVISRPTTKILSSKVSHERVKRDEAASVSSARTCRFGMRFEVDRFAKAARCACSAGTPKHEARTRKSGESVRSCAKSRKTRAPAAGAWRTGGLSVPHRLRDREWPRPSDFHHHRCELARV